MNIRRIAAWAVVPVAVVGAVLAPTGATAGGASMTIDPTEVEAGPDTTEVAVNGTGCFQDLKVNHDEATLTGGVGGWVDLTLKDPDGVTQDTAGDGTWNSTLTLPANPQTGTWSVDGTCSFDAIVCGAGVCGGNARRFVRTGPFIIYNTQVLVVTEAAAEPAAAEAVEAQPTFTG